MPDSQAPTNAALSFYARIGAALFPIPAGQKNPTGIVGSFAQDCSTDPAQHAAWAAAHPGCNFGIVAGPSRLVILDTDIKELGRDAAWTLRCALFAEWGMDPAAYPPHVQSARGGWHDLFAVPADVDAAALRQPDAIKKHINVRAGNGYVVAAGSHFENKPYLLLGDNPPHSAPPALIAHCTRAARPASATSTGTLDAGDTAKLIKWLNERAQFEAYEDWVGIGMALKLEFGDTGFDLWELTHDGTPTADLIATKWDSFATDPQPGVQTLLTWMQRAHKLGWVGTVGKSAAAMFSGLGTVAQLAAGAGATLASAQPLPMMAGQEELTRIAAPVLADFLTSTNDVPTKPNTSDYPQLPDAVSGHGLYNALRQCIDRIVAMAEQPKSFKVSRAVDALAVLSCVHTDTFDSVCRKIQALGVTVPRAQIKMSAASLHDKAQRNLSPQDDWIRDARTGLPEADNSDNVSIMLGFVRAAVRWNGWLERAEIRGFEWPEWTSIDDTTIAKLRTRCNRSGTRFRPGKDFLWESLLAIAHETPHDPVLELLDTLATKWDGVPRMSTWLSASCRVPCDLYHQAVARNIIGGIVRRVREPGCKHDTMAVLYGPQGTGKSTLAAMLALRPEWFTDSIMLGDQSKELVLSLAGKTVAEIGEMGMRGSTNASHVKAMISRQVDSGRTAYARAVSDRKRRNIFIGTTNDDEPLSDPSGNRRFLPVHIQFEIDLVWLAANVEQIFAEAAVRDAKGESFHIPRDVWAVAAEHQEAARSASDVETLLSEWFAETANTGPVSYVLASDLIHLTGLAGWKHGGTTAARGAIMKKLGFVSEKTTVLGKKTALWVRGNIVKLSDVPRIGTRYMVGQDQDGRPRVVMRGPGAI